MCEQTAQLCDETAQETDCK